jgi:cell division protein FtsI/penicillin-binding protein 2
LAGVGIATLMATGLTACAGHGADPRAAARLFVADWNRGDWSAMGQLVESPPANFAAAGPAVTAGLHALSSTHTLTAVDRTGSSASASVTSRYVLAAGGPWMVGSTMTLDEHGGRWMVRWAPSVIAPTLVAGDRLVLTREWAPRAAILGAGGTPLTQEGAMVSVGIEGSRIRNAAALTAALAAAGATASEIQGALAGANAHPTYFVPVFDLSEARYQQLGGTASALYQVPGTVFQHATARVAATPGLAAHIVGSVGPVTAAELARLGPAYDTSSVVGQTGLEQAYENRLAGSPGGSVEVVPPGGGTGRVLATWPARPGAALQTSIDPKVQQAAESALAGVSGYGALVAVKASTGQVLAAVSVPAGYQFDQALNGEFPPGSTFKVITATALIEKGLSPASAASCPPTITVDGESFHNAEGDAPAANMGQAFAESCNTAFIGLATSDLGLGTLPAVASTFGIGSAPQMGLPVFGGRVPVPLDLAGLAQTAIGQAQVVVSPLMMAMVAAAVDSGQVRAPRLVAGASDDAVAARPLPAGVVVDLQQMMAQVVAEGTAAGTGLPPGTHAKTGTAEYGQGTPQPTDAWLIGYRGDVAFAMVLQGTGNGGPTDGPVVARFLDALNSGG